MAVLFPTRAGWLFLSYVLSCAVLVKDKSLRLARLNPVFFIAFVCGLAFIIIALFLPVVTMIDNISSAQAP
jgi:hypothetical protein